MSNSNHISKLYIFAKDTDASEVIKGFKFQELKTLEIWLYNKVNFIDELIYCDYEEDIFQRDLKEYKSTFKQFKLYSSKKFSFSSIEIQKALAHFFMLFVKGEYLYDSPLFVFETNTSIASKKGNNDAKLLHQWSLSQENLPEKLLNQCTAKLKSIINDYVSNQHKKLNDSGVNYKSEHALSIYNVLPHETWILFTKSIRWIFTGISPEDAIENSIQNSLKLISKLPYPLNSNDYSKVFDRLRSVVADKSMANSPEDKLLTNSLLDQQLLFLGNRDDRTYLKALQLWEGIKKIDIFKIGEFYQVLFAAKHCRRNDYLENQSGIWIHLLHLYVNHKLIPNRLKREAIYEIVWSTLRPSLNNVPENSLKGLEILVQIYFSDFEKYTDILSIEDSHNLLVVIASSQRLNLINITIEFVNDLINRFDQFINNCKIIAIDRNVYCQVLEIEAFFYFNKYSLEIGQDNLDKAKQLLDEIISELPNAPLFPVSHLSKKIDGILELAINLGIEEKMKLLENYSEKLIPLVKQREGDFSLAKKYVEKGVIYLKTANPKNILKALDNFHKSKDLYSNEATYEGLILAVLNISQLYASIGLNLAAKYYSLTSIWFCSENQNPLFYKRFYQSFAFLLYSDFKQGSWITAIEDFENYIVTMQELNPNNIDIERDSLYINSLRYATFILALSPKISTQLTHLINDEKLKMGMFYTDLLKMGIDVIVKEAETKEIYQLVSNKIDNPPINDIGYTRIITWKAFDCIWNIQFRNDFIHNSVGEELAALLQIILVEIALHEIDFHFLNCSISVSIELSDNHKDPEQLASNSEFLWKVYLPVLNSKEAVDKKLHYGFITATLQLILDELSLLPREKFKTLFEELFNKGLGNKAFSINAYQRLYRHVYSEAKFESSMRDKFYSEILNIEQKQSNVMSGKKGLSNLYDKKKSIENITNRYQTCLKAIYLTLRKHSKSLEFKSEIIRLKKDGWLDWQIVQALFNNIVDLKAKNILRQNGKIYKTDKEWLKDLQKEFYEIGFKDEQETYVDIPLELIIGKNLNFHINQGPFLFLNSYGLENKTKYPLSWPVQKILNERYGFNIDEVIELSPFKKHC